MQRTNLSPFRKIWRVCYKHLQSLYNGKDDVTRDDVYPTWRRTLAYAG